MPACEHAEKTNCPRPLISTDTKRSSMIHGSGSHDCPSAARRTWPGNPVSYGVTRGISPLTRKMSPDEQLRLARVHDAGAGGGQPLR